MDDRDRISRLVGRRLVVGLSNGAGMVATLDEVRHDGLMILEISELGPGPTMFCPWNSLRRLRERLPWFMPPGEGPEPDEYYELYEHRDVSPEETAPELPVEHRRASARNLERVVSIAQQRTVGETTVALTSLELFGEGVGVLRYRISYGEGISAGGILEPELVVRDGSGRDLPWSPLGSSASGSEADGEVEVGDLPESGELEVEVERLVPLAFDREAGEEEVEDSYDGPWTFRFVI